MVSWRITALGSIAAGIALIAAIAVIFQDNLTRYRLNPRTPYQLYTPPPPPAYGARGAWALWPDDKESGAADVFYVHSTTYASDNHWNGPINDPRADNILRRVAAPNEAGPFMAIGAVYGPRYRQATLFAAFTHKFDGLAARQLAYGDIRAAFDTFLQHRRADKPIVLVGYGQGGLHITGLLQEYFAQDDALRANLAAAYLIGEAIPLQLFDDELSNVPPCASKDDVSCVIAYIDLEEGFDDEKRRFRQRALIWSGARDLISLSREPLLCVNPLSWTISETPASAELHLGAASATGLRMGETPPAIANATGARCVNGVLIVDSPRQSFLQRRHWFGDHWRPQDFNLFYHDLTADAERRVSNLSRHDSTVDLTPAPDDKIGE